MYDETFDIDSDKSNITKNDAFTQLDSWQWRKSPVIATGAPIVEGDAGYSSLSAQTRGKRQHTCQRHKQTIVQHRDAESPVSHLGYSSTWRPQMETNAQPVCLSESDTQKERGANPGSECNLSTFIQLHTGCACPGRHVALWA